MVLLISPINSICDGKCGEIREHKLCEKNTAKELHGLPVSSYIATLQYFEQEL